MSNKWSWFAVVLAVVCLPVITDAQPTTDETRSCSASTLEEIVVEFKEDVTDQIKGVKELIASGSKTKNETSAEEVGDGIKEHMDVVLYLLNDEITDVKELLATRYKESNETRLEELSLIHI